MEEDVGRESGLSVREQLRFTGSGSEYFRIWIVNVFLTLATAGIYAAWAKVRTRRYYYRNTLLAGHAFEYLARPAALLRGNLIVFGAFALYAAARQLQPAVAAAVAAIAYLVMPYLVWKSLRFKAHNTSFQNLRFRFGGTLGESYKTYLLLALLLPLTLGLIFPYWQFRKKKFVVDNFCYGRTYAYFGGRARFYYRTYGVAFLLALATTVVPSVLLVGLLFALVRWAHLPPAWLALAPVAIYPVLLAGAAGVGTYAYVRTANYAWEETRLGPVRFRSSLRVRPLLWLTLTNGLAVLGTLGLLFPWAKVRKTRYLLENLTVVAPAGLGDFVAAAGTEESALGDSALDFFDFEIGL